MPRPTYTTIAINTTEKKMKIELYNKKFDRKDFDENKYFLTLEDCCSALNKTDVFDYEYTLNEKFDFSGEYFLPVVVSVFDQTNADGLNLSISDFKQYFTKRMDCK